MIFLRKIETERLILRKITDKDITALTDIFKSYDVVENLHTIKYPFTFKDGKELLKLMKKDICFGVALKEQKNLIGAIWIHKLNKEQSEIGYVLNKDFWGQGLIKEALSKVIKKKIKTKTLIATTALANERSQQVLKDLGFESLGVFERDYEAIKDKSRFISKWEKRL